MWHTIKPQHEARTSESAVYYVHLGKETNFIEWRLGTREISTVAKERSWHQPQIRHSSKVKHTLACDYVLSNRIIFKCYKNVTMTNLPDKTVVCVTHVARTWELRGMDAKFSCVADQTIPFHLPSDWPLLRPHELMARAGFTAAHACMRQINNTINILSVASEVILILF